MTGAPAEMLAYSSDMRTFVSERTGREIGLWSSVFGAPTGHVSYSVHVEGFADLQSLSTKLAEDPEYHAKLAEGQSLTAAPAVDILARPIHGELGDLPPVGSYATVTRATMAGGKYMDAVGWGVEVSKHVEKISGVPTMFLSAQTGAFGDVAWIGVVPDASALDDAMAKIDADADYLKMINDAGDLFIPGSGHRSVSTRVA